MRLLLVFVAIASVCNAASPTGGDTHGQLRKAETPPSMRPLVLEHITFGEITPQSSTPTLPPSMRGTPMYEINKAPTAAPLSRPMATPATVLEPVWTTTPSACNFPARASDEALRQLQVIEDALKAIQKTLVKR